MEFYCICISTHLGRKGIEEIGNEGSEGVLNEMEYNGREKKVMKID